MAASEPSVRYRLGVTRRESDMTQPSAARSERFNIRLHPEARKRIEQAASFEGKTTSSFILASALAQAERTIRKHETMVLRRRDSEIFFDALLQPPRMNPRLAAALKEHDRRVSLDEEKEERWRTTR